jgi:uncharacterized protein YfeS
MKKDNKLWYTKRRTLKVSDSVIAAAEFGKKKLGMGYGDQIELWQRVYAQIERIADADKIQVDVLLATMVQDYTAYKSLRRIATKGQRVDDPDESQYKGE